MAWASVLGSLGGSLLSGLFGSSAQRSANRTNIMLNRENRQWMEDMSNTAYQRGTKDMLAAGLNPMLAYSQGGANVPNNSAATVQPVDAGARALGNAAQNALTAMQTSAQTQKTEADARLTTAEAQIKESQVPFAERMAEWQLNQAQQKFYSMMADMQLKDEQKRMLQEQWPLVADELRARINLMNQQASSAKAQGDIYKARLAGEKVSEGLAESLGPARGIPDAIIKAIINRLLRGN